MLRLLAEQLGALGDEGSANSSSGGGGAGGAGAAPGMASLVDTIMQQLLSKDVLYQPMKVSPLLTSCCHSAQSESIWHVHLERAALGGPSLRGSCWMCLLRMGHACTHYCYQQPAVYIYPSSCLQLCRTLVTSTLSGWKQTRTSLVQVRRKCNCCG